MSVRVTDEDSGAEAAVLRFEKSSGVIAVPGGRTFRCERVAGRSERTLQIFEGTLTAMTISWEPMSWWGFAEGSAMLGDATSGESTCWLPASPLSTSYPKWAAGPTSLELLARVDNEPILENKTPPEPVSKRLRITNGSVSRGRVVSAPSNINGC